MVSHSEIVAFPIDKVWEHFIYKVKHPEHFVPGVSNVVLVETTNDYVIREMDIQPPHGEKIRIRERITRAPNWVKFEILDHPIFSGHVDNLAERISENETRITYTQCWENKITGEAHKDPKLIEMAVLKTVAYILNSK